MGYQQLCIKSNTFTGGIHWFASKNLSGNTMKIGFLKLVLRSSWHYLHFVVFSDRNFSCYFLFSHAIRIHQVWPQATESQQAVWSAGHQRKCKCLLYELLEGGGAPHIPGTSPPPLHVLCVGFPGDSLSLSPVFTLQRTAACTQNFTTQNKCMINAYRDLFCLTFVWAQWTAVTQVLWGFMANLIIWHHNPVRIHKKLVILAYAAWKNTATQF